MGAGQVKVAMLLVMEALMWLAEKVGRDMLQALGEQMSVVGQIPITPLGAAVGAAD
jgi:hypothetical protein